MAAGFAREFHEPPGQGWRQMIFRGAHSVLPFARLQVQHVCTGRRRWSRCEAHQRNQLAHKLRMDPADLIFFFHPLQRRLEEHVDLRMRDFFRKKFTHEFAQKKRHRTAAHVLEHRNGNVGTSRFLKPDEPFRPFAAYTTQLKHRPRMPLSDLPVFAPALCDP